MKIKTRTETDFLGSRKIPDDAYYGINAVRGYENFNISGDKIDAVLIKTMAWVKSACAEANLACGTLKEDIANAITAACGKIADGLYHDQFIVNPIQGGGGTSINMAANEIIANLALEALGHKKGDYGTVNPLAHVNMSQSTNDVYPTAINLALIIKMKPLSGALNAVKKTLLDQSMEMASVVKMGRTHLNAASPIALGQCFDAYAAALGRDEKRLQNAAGHLYDVPLGGTVIGTGLNTSPQYRALVIKCLRRVSGMDVDACSNLADGIQNADDYASLSSALKVCALNISKMASDLRFLGSDQQHGIGELCLPPRQTGSSIIPDKVNPVMAELVNQVAFMVCGYDLTISMAAQAGQLELNVYKPTISYCLFRSIDLMTEAIQRFDDFCLKGLKAI